MHNIQQWAMRWGIPPEATQDLMATLGLSNQGSGLPNESSSEAGVSKRVRLDVAGNGGILWRNNVGAFEDQNTGRWIRYGLANESKAMNQKIKSHDLIGINPVMITQPMVGQVIGQFMSLEIKHPGWHWTGTEHEWAQHRFTEIVISKGGFAKFYNGDQNGR